MHCGLLRLALVDRTSMVDRNDEHDHAISFYAAEDAVITYPEAPQVREIVRQAVAECSCVLCRSDALLQILQDTPLNRLVQLRQITLGPFV